MDEPPRDLEPKHVSLAFALRTLLIVVLAIGNGVLFLLYDQHTLSHRPHSTITSLRYGIARERVQVRMLMGVQPGPVRCPKGMYRPPGGGTSRGECRLCPRGVYGDSPGLTSSDCTAKCPKGTYQDKLGATSAVDCKPCPAGVYGSSPGLTSRACTAPCPLGKYSMKIGIQTQSECDDCPANYRGPQGRRSNEPQYTFQGGYPCDRFIDAKTVLNGRTAFADAKLDAYYASTRTAHTYVVDNSS